MAKLPKILMLSTAAVAVFLCVSVILGWSTDNAIVKHLTDGLAKMSLDAEIVFGAGLVLILGSFILMFERTWRRAQDAENEHVRLEEQARQLEISDQRFRNVLDSLDAVVYVADMETYEVLFINELARKLTGDAVGKRCWESLQIGQTGPCAFCTNDRLLADDGTPNEPYIWEFQNSKTALWFECHDQAIKWTDGRYVRMEIAYDITERKQAQEALHASERQKRLIVNTLPDLMWLKDIDGVYVACNRVYEKYVGAKEEDIIGKTDADFFDAAQAQTFRHHDQEAIDADGPIAYEEEIEFLDDGHKALLETIKTPLKTEFGIVVGVLGIGRDITAHKKAEEALARSNEELAERTEEEVQLRKKLEYELNVKDRLFSIISHDLRSPFTSLLGMSELMVEASDKFTKPQLVDYAHRINQSGEQVFKLLENLLTWARLQMGGEHFEPRAISMPAIVDEAIDLLGPVAQKKHINLMSDMDGDIVAFADADMVLTVLRNLISNAIKFTNETGTVKVALEYDGDMVLATVDDTGVGISPKHLGGIFELDQKTSTEGTAGEKGTGLGLPLSKEMVEKNGGKIWVVLSSAKGTTFAFTLPGTNPVLSP